MWIHTLGDDHPVRLLRNVVQVGILGKSDQAKLCPGIPAHQIAQHGLPVFERFARHAGRSVHQNGDGHLLHSHLRPRIGEREDHRRKDGAFERQAGTRSARHPPHPHPQDGDEQEQNQRHGVSKGHKTT
jgi:hypothetical protein